VRRALLTAAFVLVAVAALMPASAAGHSLVRHGGSVVTYLSADATSLNTLRAVVSDGRVDFRDETVDGGMDPGTCMPGDIDGNGYIISTSCSLSGVKRVRIDLGEREDSATVSLTVATTLLGGPGADNLASGRSDDELSGGEGNDLVSGGAGRDVVTGDQGQDTLNGGTGSDRIVSRDGEADTVTCGDGTDTVEADTLDQVASDCEDVVRVAVDGSGVVDDGKPPKLQVGALTLQRLGRSRVVRVFATSSERGTVSASGGLDVGNLVLPVKTIDRKRIRVGGGGAVLSYKIRGRHWREARRALRRGRDVVLRLGVVATDLAGRSTERKAPAIEIVGGGGKRAGDGVVRARASHPEPGDVDGDEVKDEVDNCPTVKNGGQANADGDGQGDACDDNDDNDERPDSTDNCRTVANGPDFTDTDGDGYGDACPPVHSDSDGIIDDNDNCDATPNPNQEDLDGDDKGDACDNDVDGDDFDNQYDNCPTVYNIEPTDTDGDGFVNDQADADKDGIGTACDGDESLFGGPGGVDDGKRPKLGVRVGRRQQMRAVRAGLIVKLRCNEACDSTVMLEVPRRLARKLGLSGGRVIASGSVRLQGAGTSYAFVRFDRRVRRKLFRMDRVSSKLVAVAVDVGGNRRRLSRRVALIG
jgi:RTX calcium-binding nonapeptide repeat (4 copies)/Thrombospondin type 3 repeat